MKRRRGIIFVISSPSGGGKTTICKRLKRERFDVEYSISATTRKRRAEEVDGKDYHFLKRENFKRLVAEGKFLEWTDNFGDFYGTPKDRAEKAVSRGRDIILSIDVKGAMQVKKIDKAAVLIFLLPPSFGLLSRRLKKRGTEDSKTLARRLKMAKKELRYLNRYDYAIVNNNMAKAVNALKSIIIAERSRLKRKDRYV